MNGNDDEKPATMGSTGKSTTETVTLKCQHTHNREVREAGEQITVTKRAAANLRAQGVCK
ncbi:MAG: hypothetical protein BRD57_06515 [Proteobacteria bacterium SW_6_67_9]|nr:MAG: hypothetical protein BRD57_06515 [Proteobacteria bacterium SW_6_67_9]